MNTARVEELWQESKEVLQNCALPNGALVAANSDLSVYPASAEDYRYVWGRDNAFQVVAAHTLEIPRAADIRANYLKWLWERAEGFAQTGVIVKRYSTNGPLDWHYGTEYQPDQSGSLLWALTETQTDPDELVDNTIRLMANGLTAQWEGSHFHSATQDLWENRLTNPAHQDVFTYSVASVAYGLDKAAALWRGKTIEVDNWEQARDGMYGVLESDQASEHYLRKIYAGPVDDPDNTLDASLNGLIFPFSNFRPETSPRQEETVLAIGRFLCQLPDGVARYTGDTYDGIVRPGGVEATAGRWPLLTFWHAIALHKIGQRDAARELYETTIDRLDELYKAGALPNNLIPEQLFPDDRQGKAVLPLAWSHAMFAIATKELAIL